MTFKLKLVALMEFDLGLVHQPECDLRIKWL